MKYTRDYVVDESSAAPIIDNTERCGIAADHRGMCKFNNNGLQGFRTAAAALRRYMRDAPEVVRSRQMREEKALQERQIYLAVDNMRGIDPSMPWVRNLETINTTTPRLQAECETPVSQRDNVPAGPISP